MEDKVSLAWLASIGDSWSSSDSCWEGIDRFCKVDAETAGPAGQ
jgi:hypothetical protein